MRHIAWAVTWIVVRLATTLATANVLTHDVALQRAAAPPPVIAPVAPATEQANKPIAKARPSVKFSRSAVLATRRHRDIDSDR